MTPDRDLMAGLWMVVSVILERASKMLGGDKDRPFFTFEIRKGVGRLVRMAEFIMRRLIVIDALGIVESEEIEPVVESPKRKALRTQNASQSEDLPRYVMALVQSFADLRPKPAKTSEPARHGRFDPMPPLDADRLRLKIDGLNAAFKARALRAQKLAQWFASRGERCCIPWRYGHTPFMRHREFGQDVREVVDNSDRRLNAYISARAPPD